MCLFLTSLSTAVNDVVIDARLVEVARVDPKNGANNLQSLSWCAMAVGGIMGSLLAGPALESFGPRAVFLLATVGPVSVSILSLFMTEPRVVQIHSDQDPVAQCCARAKHQFAALFSAFQITLVWKAALFIFLSGAISPSFGQLTFAFVTDVLKFTPEFMGVIGAVGYLFLIFGTVLYNVKFKHFAYRKILFMAQIALIVISFSDLLIVTRANLTLGIPDKVRRSCLHELKYL